MSLRQCLFCTDYCKVFFFNKSGDAHQPLEASWGFIILNGLSFQKGDSQAHYPSVKFWLSAACPPGCAEAPPGPGGLGEGPLCARRLRGVLRRRKRGRGFWCGAVPGRAARGDCGARSGTRGASLPCGSPAAVRSTSGRGEGGEGGERVKPSKGRPAKRRERGGCGGVRRGVGRGASVS